MTRQTAKPAPSLRSLLFCGVLLLFVLAVPAIARGAQLAYVASEGSADVSAIDTATNAAAKSITAGAKPFAIAVTPDGKTAYVANEASASVSVIDTATNTVAKTIAVGTRPVAITITPDGKTAYVANDDSENVSVIDIATNTVTKTIAVGIGPVAIAITTDGKAAYVLDNGSGTVSVIDTSTNAAEETIPVGTFPIAIAIAPDGKVYVANIGSENVSVIDTANKSVKTITVGNRPLAVAIGPDGKAVFVANQFSKSVSAIDTADDSVKPITVGSAPAAIAITPDGMTAYVANQSSESVSAIDTTNKSVKKTIMVGREPAAIAITPDGKTAYVANEDSASVSAIDVATNTVAKTIAVGANPRAIAIANAPDRPPLAAFDTGSARARPGVPFGLDASPSKDPDSPIASYTWSFGDGQSQSLATPKVTHTFQSPGTYTVSVEETDAEGCSTTPFTFPFAGANMLCEGNAKALVSKQLTVAYPGVKVSCPKSAKPKGCSFKLQGIAAKPKRGKAPKFQSALARAKVKPGRSATVSLIPKPSFAQALAAAQSILVRETLSAKGELKTRYVKLPIVQ